MKHEGRSQDKPGKTKKKAKATFIFNHEEDVQIGPQIKYEE